MTALKRALELLAPGDVLDRLAAYLGKSAPRLEGGRLEGVLCDFRPGCEEENPSLSYRAGDAGPLFHRFGGDGFEGGAVAFLESAGLTKAEAVRLLIEWAGLEDEHRRRGESTKSAPHVPAARNAAGLEKAGRALAKLRPLEDTKRRAALRGWQRVEDGEDTPEAAELARRGLTPALTSGLLTAYQWNGEGEGGKRRSLPRHILPGAVAFEVIGPDGTPWAVKARNPGTKAELKAVGAQRYVYVTAGQSTPACVTRVPRHLPRETRDGVRFLIVEGELNAVAAALMLEAAGAAGWEVQGVASAVALPHVAHIPAGAHVYLHADPDEEGNKARQTWAALLAGQGAHVYQIEAGDASPFAVTGRPDADACDALGAGNAAHLGARLLDALGAAPRWAAPEGGEDEAAGPRAHVQGQAGDVWETKRRGYGVRGGKLCALTIKNEDGEDVESVEVLADFAAVIVSEVTQEDGSGDAARVFEVEGHRPDGRPMNPARVMVTAAEFSGMAWPVAKWGAAARLPAGNGKKDKARDAIQALSLARGLTERTVYQHTGWTLHPVHGRVFLTAGAVIGHAGGVEGVDVELSGRLAAYALPDPAKAEAADVCQAVRASLDLLNLAPDSVAVPLLGAAYRAVLGPCDFVVWTVGETGKHKTALTGLVMSHFGQAWSRKFLPDGWNSSANFLEVNAFRAKDVLFVIDDFKPSGGAVERAKLDGVASRIIQGAADGAGRGTLTADRRSRAGLWPRGLVATSAEDLPRGHSNRARLVIVEVQDRLIHSPAMSAAYYSGEEQGAAGVYSLALAAFIQAVAAHFDELHAGSAGHRHHVRTLAPHFEGAHGRTGDAAAELTYGWSLFLSFAAAVGAVEEAEAAALWERVTAALRDTAQGQGHHLTEADPVARAVGILSELLAQGRVYLADKETGGQPDAEDAQAAGWQERRWRGEGGEEERTFEPRRGADLLGYVSFSGGQRWGHFLPDALHAALQEVARRQGGAALPDPAKLWANARDKLHAPGFMRCNVEGGRVRATAKAKTPDGQMRQFITLALPLDGISEYLGNLGNQVGERASETALNGFPTLSIFPFEVGNLGNLQRGHPSSSSPESLTPPLPAAGPVLTLADLEDLAEGEDLPGVVTL